MRQIREAYADAKQELTPEARTTLMSLTLSFDKCIWLLGRIAGLEGELQLRQAQR